ncbi:MAG: STN domain-containing protein, partial [Bacteroidales bacterium]
MENKNLMLASVLLLGTLSPFQNAFARENFVKLEMRGATLPEVLNVIGQQTNMSVIYNVKNIDANKRYDLNFQSSELTEVLEKSLANTNLTYAIRNNHIILSEKPAQQ